MNKTFQDVAAKKFLCDIESLNFGNNVQAARTINDFVEKKTHNKIKNFIEPSSINKNTAVMLINSIYFKCYLDYQFSARLTEFGDFYVNENETARTHFIRATGFFLATKMLTS